MTSGQCGETGSTDIRTAIDRVTSHDTSHGLYKIRCIKQPLTVSEVGISRDTSHDTSHGLTRCTMYKTTIGDVRDDASCFER